MDETTGPTLTTKLGVKDGSVLVVLHAPPDFWWAPPSSVRVSHRARGRGDVVLAFFTKRAVFEQQREALYQLIEPGGSLWIAWPKRASGVTTDMTDHVAREVLLPLGLVDNKVCAIDTTWTGLRFMRRRKL